jgi:hypothetical protein
MADHGLSSRPHKKFNEVEIVSAKQGIWDEGSEAGGKAHEAVG